MKLFVLLAAATGIDQVRDAAGQFTRNLPDFTCEQQTRRFEGRGKPLMWIELDRVTADVLYMRGAEHYTVKGSPAVGRTWSGGEYGNVQLDVLASYTNAKFTFKKRVKYNRRPALLFEYSVAQESSHWDVEHEGIRIRPAYEGQMWVDPENDRPLRIEMNAREIPVSYPLKVIETSVDYGLVSVAGRDLLLPVRAVNLACLRKLIAFVRNETEFRDYKKFTADSTLTSTDSTITFKK